MPEEIKTTEVEQNEQVDTQTETPVKTFTQEQVNSMIKANVDRAVAKAHKEAQEQQAEAEKLRKMNADEKAEFEKNKREEELKKREAEITRRELIAEAKIMLAEKNLSVNFAPYLIGADAEETKENLNNFGEEFDKAVKEAVELKFKTNGREVTSYGNGNVKQESIHDIANELNLRNRR